jgi:hypothetical protein
MAVWSTSTNLRLLASGRCDAEFSRPEHLRDEAILAKHETVPLRRAFYISDGNHSTVSRYFTDDATNGVPYFRGQDLNSFYLANATPMRIPQSVYNRSVMRRSHFAVEDVLICIVGASTGTIGVVVERDLPATGSCKIGIIRRQPRGRIDPLYLSAFLMGHFGQFQIRRNTRGTAQGGLILKDIYTLVVPTFDESIQRAIREQMLKAVDANAAALTTFANAQMHFEDALGFADSRLNGSRSTSARTSTTTVSNIFAANRIDAQCFAPDALAYDGWLSGNADCERLRILLHSPMKGRQ